METVCDVCMYVMYRITKCWENSGPPHAHPPIYAPKLARVLSACGPRLFTKKSGGNATTRCNHKVKTVRLPHNWTQSESFITPCIDSYVRIDPPPKTQCRQTSLRSMQQSRVDPQICPNAGKPMPFQLPGRRRLYDDGAPNAYQAHLDYTRATERNCDSLSQRHPKTALCFLAPFSPRT